MPVKATGSKTEPNLGKPLRLETYTLILHLCIFYQILLYTKKGIDKYLTSHKTNQIFGYLTNKFL